MRFVLVAATLGVFALSASANDRKPNIIVILADDLGYGDVSCYNPKSKVATPNLDALARQGMRFTDAHSPATVCTPSRYSLMTGRMAFRIPYRGVFTGAGGPCLIEAERLTLPQMLRSQGYTTACIGKWHIGLTFHDRDGKVIKDGSLEGVKRIDYSRPIPDAPIHRGFDSFFGTACCPTTDWLYAFIEGDRIPVPPTDTIDPAKLPQHPYSKDCRQGVVAPGFDLEEIDMVFLDKTLKFLENHAKTKRDTPFFLYHATQAVHLPSFAGKDFRGKTKAGPHGDFIFEFDHIVGEILKSLEKHGFADNTLVIVTSDNGPEVTTVVCMRSGHGHDGAFPWRGVKRDNWEGGHRVPFIARWPGRIPAGTTTDQTICLTDLMATSASLLDVKLPRNAGEDSVNLLPVLLNKQGKTPIREYTLYQTINLSLGIRNGPWVYLDHKGSGGNDYSKGMMQPFALPERTPEATAQLYNLEIDPGQKMNVYNEHRPIADRLKKKLDSFKENGRSTPE